jgi:hypothetical protein
MSRFEVTHTLDLLDSGEISEHGAVAILGNYMPHWQAEQMVAYPQARRADQAAERRLQAARENWRELALFMIDSAELELELVELRDVA